MTAVEVEEVLDPAGLSSASSWDATPVDRGQVLVVRQFDRPAESVLQPGSRYLLFLNPSALAGPESEHFYVVGAVAGVYRADGDEFRRTSTEDPELPESLTVGQVAG